MRQRDTKQQQQYTTITIGPDVYVGPFTNRHTSTVCKIRDNDLNLTVRSKTSEIDVSR
ncbi:hypothetical protein OAV88_02390 [bacterium]|nr:hypothetical protein [bacterium]